LTVTLSVAGALTVIVVLLCRYAALRVWHALTCIMLGFFLASTSLAPDINQITHSLIRML
jgi:hypothetical protein